MGKVVGKVAGHKMCKNAFFHENIIFIFNLFFRTFSYYALHKYRKI